MLMFSHINDRNEVYIEPTAIVAVVDANSGANIHLIGGDVLQVAGTASTVVAAIRKARACPDTAAG